MASWYVLCTLNFQFRCQLLLRAYKTTIEEDNALLGGAKPLSPCSLIAIRMRLSEKKILQNAVTFARTLRERLLSEPEQRQNGGSEPTAVSQPTDAVGAADCSSGDLSEGHGETVGSDGEEGGGERELNGELQQLDLNGEGEERESATEKDGKEVGLVKGEDSEREGTVGGDEGERESDGGGGGGCAAKTELEQTNCVNGISEKSC